MVQKTRNVKEIIGFAFPKQALEKLDRLSVNTGLSRSEIIRTVMLRYLEEKEKEVD